jgi:hypothetical protein
MRFSKGMLAGREPALAALMGAAPRGASFGAEWERSRLGADLGGFGGFGGFGADAALAAHPDPQHPANQAAMLALWRDHQHKATATAQRLSHMRPNEHSTVKIEGMSFDLPMIANTGASAPAFTAGTPSAFTASGFPKSNIKPTQITINVNSPGFIFVQTLQVANADMQLGSTKDAVNYSYLRVGMQMSLPELTTSTPVTVTGFSTAALPTGFAAGAAYPGVVTMEGPGSILPLNYTGT